MQSCHSSPSLRSLVCCIPPFTLPRRNGLCPTIPADPSIPEPPSVHLMGVCLMSVYFTGCILRGMHLTGVLDQSLPHPDASWRQNLGPIHFAPGARILQVSRYVPGEWHGTSSKVLGREHFYVTIRTSPFSGRMVICSPSTLTSACWVQHPR